jgi:hypothetical protein
MKTLLDLPRIDEKERSAPTAAMPEFLTDGIDQERDAQRAPAE